MTGILTFIIAISAMLFGVRLLPVKTVVKDQLPRSANANNNLLRITMKRDLGKYASAIWAQEYYEVLLKRRHIIKSRTLKFRNDMELVSHEIETQVAVTLGADEHDYRMSEAASLHRGYQGRFSDMPVERINDILKSNKGEALKFISKNRDRIEKAKRYG